MSYMKQVDIDNQLDNQDEPICGCPFCDENDQMPAQDRTWEMMCDECAMHFATLILE